MKYSIILILLIGFSSFAQGDIAVVVHPSNSSALEAADIERIFTGKKRSFPDGSQAVPVNQVDNSTATAEFNDKVLGRSSSQLKAYWSKLVFTGKGTPPKEVDADAEVISLVANNPNIIGYVSSSAVTDKVKVVASF